MATKVGKMGIYSEELSPIKSPDPLIRWSWKVNQNMLAALSLLSQELWPLYLAKWWLTGRIFNPLSHKSHRICGHVRLCDKLKMFYIQCHNMRATKPSRVVTYNDELPSTKPFYPLITWSFDFSHTICRFRTQALKLSPTFCYNAFYKIYYISISSIVDSAIYVGLW